MAGLTPRRLTSLIELRLVTADAERLAPFYAALGFAIEPAVAIPPAEIALLGLTGSGTRTVLRLGGERIALDRFERQGSPYPVDGSATDLDFQHVAIVTSDAAAAWERARANGAAMISRGPVALPASSGSVIAVKFRDPEGHPLECLQFPPGGEGRWTAKGMLGIDHTAIVVSDLQRARDYYGERELRGGDATLNHGPEQAALDGVEAPVVDVVPMHAPSGGPHLELLAYRQPRGGSSGRAMNDIAATRTVWRADAEALIRDPDGHLHQLSR